jgi:hypothetical protein
MSVGKKKVIVYTDWIIQFKDLTDEEAGKLIKHFFNYINDLKPESDRLTELLFNPIKATLKRDLQSWKSKQQTNKENGLKGGRPKKEITEINPNNPNGFLITQNNPEKGVSDSVSVSVNVNDKKDINTFDFKKSCIDFGFKSELVVDWLKVRKNKKLTNTETAFNKFINQIKLNGQDKDLILEKCIEKSWGGFESDWFKSQSIINKIDNPHGLSPALLESDRLARIAIEEAIKQKAIDKELDRQDELRRKQQNS